MIENGLIIAMYIIIFFIYTFFGAVFEHMSYYAGDTHKILNNPVITGFPVYGFGALLVYWLIKKIGITSAPAMFATGAVTGTIIEYIVGRWIAHAGKYDQSENEPGIIKSWDYRNEPFNIDGIISLRHFMTWGIAGVVVGKLTPILETHIKRALI